MDDLGIKRPLDAKKINVHELWECTYWSNKFGVSVSKLKEAVATVGVNVEDVKKYLKK